MSFSLINHLSLHVYLPVTNVRVAPWQVSCSRVKAELQPRHSVPPSRHDRYYSESAIRQALAAARVNWTIELLQNQGHPVCMNLCESDPRAKDWPPLTEESKLIGYGDTFRISLTTIKAKQTVSTEEPFRHLVIMLTDMHGHIGPEGSAGMDFNQKRGNIMFHDSHGNHGLTNSGNQDVRRIVAEFKPASNSASKE
jgi:hypothetical protein